MGWTTAVQLTISDWLEESCRAKPCKYIVTRTCQLPDVNISITIGAFFVIQPRNL